MDIPFEYLRNIERGAASMNVRVLGYMLAILGVLAVGLAFTLPEGPLFLAVAGGGFVAAFVGGQVLRRVRRKD